MKTSLLLLISVCLLTTACLTARPPEKAESKNTPEIGIIIPANRLFNIKQIEDGAERLAEDFAGSLINDKTKKSHGNNFSIEIIRLWDTEGKQLQVAADKYKILVIVSHEFNNTVSKIYRNYPETHFILMDAFIEGVEPGDNITILPVTYDQGGFAAGVAAALSGANKIGYIGAVESEFITRIGSAFIAGAMFTDRAFTDPGSYRMEYVGSWAAPDKAYEIADEMYSEGTDLIFHRSEYSAEGIYRTAEEHRRNIIGMMDTDVLYLQGSDGSETNLDRLGDLVTCLLTKRLDNMLYNIIGEYLETGRIEGGYRNPGFEQKAWTIVPNKDNIKLISAVWDIIAPLVPGIKNYSFRLPASPEDMGRYVEQLKGWEPPDIGGIARNQVGQESAGMNESMQVTSVMTLSLEKLSVSEGYIIEDLLSSALIETGIFRVIDRTQREAILKEIEFSLTGCTDESCQLEAGKLLAADTVITGSAGLIGSKYILNLKMIDVQTSVAEQTAYRIFSSLDDMVEGIRRLVEELIFNR